MRRSKLYSSRPPLIGDKNEYKIQYLVQNIRGWLFLIGAFAIAAFVLSLVWGPSIASRTTILERGITVSIVDDGGDKEVWVSQTGNDSASGLETDPVKTLGGAVAKLSENSVNAKTCYIRVIGVLDLGFNPVFCSDPIQSICKDIVITGRQFNVIETTVENRATSELYNFITDAVDIPDAGLTGNEYQKFFMQNKVQDRVYIIENHTSTRFEILMGDASSYVFPYHSTPTSIQVTESVFDGDAITLYTIEDGLLFSGNFVFDVPYNDVLITNLDIRAPANFTEGGIESFFFTFVAPNTFDPRVIFKACHFDVTIAANVQTFIGSYVLKGVYAKQADLGGSFNIVNTGACKFMQMESVWLDDLEVNNVNELHGLGVKIINGGAITATSGNAILNRFIGFNTKLEGVEQFSRFSVQNFYLENTFILARNNQQFYLSSGTAKNGNIFANAIDGGQIFMSNSIQLSGYNTIAQAEFSSSIHIRTAPLIENIGTGPAYIAKTNSKMHLTPSIIDLSSASEPVLEVLSSTVYILANGADINWATTAGVPLVDAKNGANVYYNQATLVNQNVATDVIRCGNGVAISTWTTNIQDVSSNTFCSIRFP